MINQVISWKFNDQEGMSTKDGKITEFPGGIPSQSDQDTWTAEYNDFISANAYKESRKAEYPDWGTQLNKIYDDGLTKWKSEMVDPIKAKYPKP